MRSFGPRRKLGLKQRGDEEAESRQFDGACFAKNTSRTYAQSGGLKLLFVFLIHAVVAVILLGIVFAAANRMQECSRENLQALLPGSLGTVRAAVRQGAGKGRHHEVRRPRIIFRGVGVGNLQNISRIL